ncbi:hypothetical protein ABW20_dc0100838 [Dactylellina cionopaga]|nr:hypothetical protein ABW20_dc0100838 [Dactylellina cionopaga]
MRFSTFFAIAFASMAVLVGSLPLSLSSSYDIARRDISSVAKLMDALKNIDLEKLSKLISVPKPAASTKRSPEPEDIEVEEEIEEDPTPVAGSGFNKKSAIPDETETETDEMEEELIRRSTTMSPNVGIPQGLPSGIVIFMIVFMFYAMITVISMKDTDP